MSTETQSALRERWSVSSKLTAFEVWLLSFAAFRDLVGNHNRDLLVRSMGGRGSFLTSSDDLKAAAEIGLAFYSDPAAVIQFEIAAMSAGRDYRRVAAEVSQDVAGLDDGALAKRFDRLFAANIRCMAHYKATGDEFSTACEARLQSELEPLGAQRDSLLMDALSADEAELDVTAERRAWLSLVRRRLSPDGVEDRDLAGHAARYGYLGAMGGNPAGWTFEHYKARISRSAQELAIELAALEQAESGAGRRLVARETAERQLELFPWAAMVVGNLRDCTVSRMYLRECFTSAAQASNPLFRELYRRIGAVVRVDAGDPVLRQLGIGDIATFLACGRLDVDELRRRQVGFVMTLEGDRTRLETGRAIEGASAHIPASAEDPQRRLRGRTVWGREVVVGKAFVLDSGLLQARKVALIATMAPGDILVTGMTHPNIIEACERARAIVTDEGGLTCHAAIVARELNIPCIVATERATRIFRTGDVIELDPATGTVAIRQIEGAAS